MHTLPKLPFSIDSLAPQISQETLEYHYGKHHKTYVDNLNKLITNTKFENNTLEEIISTSSGGIFNNAAQIWNHSFYWQCLTPHQTTPSEDLESAISQKFTSVEKFKQEFSQKALTNFGSGWTWLVKNQDNSLEIVNTSNAQTPITSTNQIPLLTCDVWEHAYYIDYRNARAKYLDAYWLRINWDFANERFNK